MRRIAAGLILAAIAAHSQPPNFDVASLKPSPPSSTDAININLGSFNHGVVTLGNTTLSECIRFAYGLVSEDQISGPDWIRDRGLRVDITAKTSPDTSLDQARLMLQTLLAERFRLAIHSEPRPLRHFDLTVAPKGPKLHDSPPDAQTALKGYGKGRLAYDHLPMRTLVVLLSRQLKQPVIDLTGLPGFYDIQLEWTPDDPAPQEPAATAAAALPDIFHAVEDQLGLRLEPKKTPIDIIVIDHAEKTPAGN